MSQIATLVNALKRKLKQQGITYAVVASQLGLSTTSVKRLFSEKSFSLKRLEQICALIDLDLSDLLEITRDEDRYLSLLTEAQERALVNDEKLLLVAFLLFSHWSFEEILKNYDISKTEGIRLLARLDRLKIIDLLPNNRVKMHLARNFIWRKDGPIQRFFEAHVQDRFFESSFSGPGELRLVMNGMLSSGSNQVLQQRIKRLAAEFESMMEEDRKLDTRQRRGTSMLLAIRPWELDVFAQFRRTHTAQGNH